MRTLRFSPDHPRSRGVYSPTRPGWEPFAGSSPLARGLPRGDLMSPGRLRIIPARAGFTPPHRASLRGRRIIPARAGFTPHHRWPHGPDRDHPRSRGVYRDTFRARAENTGSSPLARGLPPPGCSPRGRPGIIPARAGFTRRAWSPRPGRRDHPRSRGVYSSPCATASPRRGSSPLARGLPANVYPAIKACGIIPARAGFTTSFAGLAAFDRGSSPLARGLQRGRRDLHGQDRIIPARAGFT